MTERQLPRVMIAGTGSGTGKTTITCALLRALLSRGKKVVSMKCGPDYIDPMFHREVLGTKSGNLDLFLLGEAGARSLLGHSATGADLAVLEGVMGYYDGIGTTTDASSYQAARVTGTPVILAVNAAGMSLSVAALVRGFGAFRPDSGIAGVIFNRLPPALYPEIKARVEAETGIPVLGYLPKLPDCALESRHLGLITAGEVAHLREKLDALGRAFLETVDIGRIERIAQSAPPLSFDEPARPVRIPATIAVARDKAFCFYYEDALEALERMGAKLSPFSPLEDKTLPLQAGGLLLGGGYPELYAKALSENAAMLDSIRAALQNGMPCVAECGGFLYLGKGITTEEGERYPMAGVLPMEAHPTRRLRRFGYLTLTARRDNLLCRAGERIPAHEFHYYDTDQNGADFLAEKASRPERWECGYASDTLYAGFPHFHFGGSGEMAARFLQKCAAYERTMGR
ncbi:cobyrinate a,c-diamide synthase [Zongyangia hominis]|uniref:Cobyrinate a,c-diamide synthase n=1 Tax=Zongyangia hominis TaxID=2763677 RepID=A0A926I9M0_9FIRM|nr:cobyrinate a,c-diamide synthase [Zongyangia hominis]MBC8569296.1 cobyrinate a,c-diamide synthase [Zongyangia hominis]